MAMYCSKGKHETFYITSATMNTAQMTQLILVHRVCFTLLLLLHSDNIETGIFSAANTCELISNFIHLVDDL